MRRGCQPRSVVSPEKVKPGSEGATTWKSLGEWRHHVEELEDGTRPAVHEEERDGVGVRGPGVQQVDPLPVDLGHELRHLVQARLGRPPVVPVAPVLEQRDEVAALGALLPADPRDLVRQAGPVEPLVQVVEDGGRDVHGERLHGASLAHRLPRARHLSTLTSMSSEGAMTALGRLLLERAEDDRPALLYEDRRWTYRDLVDEGWRRAALFAELRDADRPPHVGVLLDNVPDYLFWLTAGALSGTVVVGINSTYRGEQLAQLIDHTDCQALVTSSDLAGLLDGAPHTVPAERVLVVDEPGYADAARRRAADRRRGRRRRPTTTCSCSSSRPARPGCPRRCAARRAGSARTGAHVAGIAELTADDVVYAPLPFFHSASLFTGLGVRRARRRPDLDPDAVLRVGHRARHPRASARRSSPTRARSSTTCSACPRRRTTPRSRCGSRSATRRRSTTSGSSPAASAATCATATARPRA